MEGIPFIGQNGFYPRWAKGSSRWLFQRTLTSVGTMAGYAELAASEVATANQIIVWVPPRRMFGWAPSSTIHLERQQALAQLGVLSMRCYGNECNLNFDQPLAIRTIIYERGIKPEQWSLICPLCGGIVGPNLEPVTADGVIRRWNKVGKPALENPCASALFKSAAAVSDLPAWILSNTPSHLELAYLGQQMWRSIDIMFQGLDTYARQAQTRAATTGD